MRPPLVEFTHCTLRYGPASRPALRGLTVRLGAGIVGLIGANGAGKTSLLRLLSDGVDPSEGQVRIAGQSPRVYRLARGLGSIPERPAFPAWLTVAEFLDGLRAVSGHPLRTEVEQTLGRALELDALGERRLQTLSLGQARRVELAAALIGDPDVLVLDEPTNGLDPVAVAALRRGLLAARRPGRLILISSHHLDELQRMVDRILALRDGTLVGDWSAVDAVSAAGSLEALFLAVGAHDAA
jgi:ABC-2 type transport system ATP-binding protein